MKRNIHDDVYWTEEQQKNHEEEKPMPKIEEQVARAFHETYELLAPTFNYETRKASAVPWSKVPGKNKQLMIAVVKSLLDREIIQCFGYCPPPDLDP